jgi:hypothetical protein
VKPPRRIVTAAAESRMGYCLNNDLALRMVDALRFCWFAIRVRDALRFWRRGEG